MKPRDLVLVAILLAIGTVLYAFVPNIANVTPDFVYVFATLALLLVRPKMGAAIGIGVVAAILGMAFSKSAVPWINIPGHILGVMAGAWYISYTPDNENFRRVKPLIGATIYGLIGGGIAVTLIWIFAGLPIQAYLFGMWPLVFVTTAIAAVINLILYPPALNAYQRYATSAGSVVE